MKLEARQMIRANTIFMFLKGQTPDYLEKHKITRCTHCNGFGIMAQEKTLFWNGTDYCAECKGIGFRGLTIEGGLQVSDTLYLCKNCAGLGCRKCEEKGVVDWISHAMG